MDDSIATKKKTMDGRQKQEEVESARKNENNMEWIKKTTGVAYNGIIALEQRLFSADCHTQT